MASAGGISKPILYRHFVDRDGLVAAITESALVELGAILDDKIAEARADRPPHSIRATIDAVFEYVEKEPQLYRFIVDSDSRGGNLATMAFTEQIAQRVADTLAQGLVDHGRDPAPAAIWGRAIVGMVQNTAAWWIGGADSRAGRPSTRSPTSPGAASSGRRRSRSVADEPLERLRADLPRVARRD